MDRLKMIVAIADKGSGEKMARALIEAGCQLNLQLAGRGTAKAVWMDCLGLCETHKDIVLALCPGSRVKPALEKLERAAEGLKHYLALAVPLNSIAGKAEGEEQHG